MSFRRAIADSIPWARRIKCTLDAWCDARWPVRPSYAQDGEDAWLWRQVQGLDLAGAIYVDVGANLPTVGSNTYLLYRRGLRGILLEPNADLVPLLRRFRPRDFVICAACSAEAGMREFRVYRDHVFSSLAGTVDHAANGPTKLVRTDAVPVLPLDSLLDIVPENWIALLSIDAEGHEEEVLCGATRMLPRVLYLCIEALDDRAERRLRGMIADRFVSERRIGNNLMLRNRLLQPPVPTGRGPAPTGHG